MECSSGDRWDLIQTGKFLNFHILIIYIYLSLSHTHTQRTNSLRSSEFQTCCLCWFINDTVQWASMNHTRAVTDSCLSLNVLFQFTSIQQGRKQLMHIDLRLMQQLSFTKYLIHRVLSNFRRNMKAVLLKSHKLVSHFKSKCEGLRFK